MSGMRRNSSRNITVISRRARWAPRQKCGPGPPKPRWSFGVRRDVEAVRVVEHRLVAVGRRVPEHDLVALVELLVADADAVLGDGAPEVDHRRGPAHDLLDRGRRPAPSKSASQRCLLVGVLGERRARPWEMALRVVSLPATTSRMKNDASSGGRQRLAVDLGGDQRGGEVVLRVLHRAPRPAR